MSYIVNYPYMPASGSNVGGAGSGLLLGLDWDNQQHQA